MIYENNPHFLALYYCDQNAPAVLDVTESPKANLALNQSSSINLDSNRKTRISPIHLYSVFCTLTLYSVSYILYFVCRILYFEFSILYYCTMHSVFSVVISGYLWLSLTTISNYLMIYLVSINYQGASRSRREQEITRDRQR